ncbi:MAG: hypothetical protein ACW97Z_14930 [Candidatus Hodarchaeales archaeon]|jgi:uncharacterized coiled-coil DUF342 family protein
MRNNNQEIELINNKLDSLSRQVEKLREAVALIHNTTNGLINRIEIYEEKIKGINQAVSFIQNSSRIHSPRTIIGFRLSGFTEI